MQVPDPIFDMPAYSCPEAARYIGVSKDTLRRWTGNDGLIAAAAENALSFNNLAEAHILKAMRRIHGLPMQRIRKALSELAQIRQTAHPLLDEMFETDGVHLCIRDQEEIINLSQRSQREFREFVTLYLHRIHRDERGKIARLYPFIKQERENEPKSISISPVVSFGKPVLDGTAISTSVIVGRFNARDSIADLAREYQVAPSFLEDAIRWEMNRGMAA